MFRFAFEYADRNRTDLQKFIDFEEFNKQFKITTVVFSEFMEFAEKKGVKPDDVEISSNKDRIKTLLKANIARNLFDDKGFYPIYLTIDNVFLEAINVLNE